MNCKSIFICPSPPPLFFSTVPLLEQTFHVTSHRRFAIFVFLCLSFVPPAARPPVSKHGHNFHPLLTLPISINKAVFANNKHEIKRTVITESRYAFISSTSDINRPSSPVAKYKRQLISD